MVIRIAAFILAISSLCHAAKKPVLERINGEYWQIKWLSVMDGGDAGRTECPERVIYAVITDCEVEVDTIIHESLHALTCTCTNASWCHPDNQKYNNPYEGGDTHPGIYYLSPRLLRWIRENPDLVKWIQNTTPTP